MSDSEQTRAQGEYDEAARRSDEAQEALGRAEDELSAAEADRAAAERGERGADAVGGVEQRLEAAERAWDDSVDDAERAMDRHREAREALDEDAEGERGEPEGR